MRGNQKSNMKDPFHNISNTCCVLQRYIKISSRYPQKISPTPPKNWSHGRPQWSLSNSSESHQGHLKTNPPPLSLIKPGSIFENIIFRSCFSGKLEHLNRRPALYTSYIQNLFPFSALKSKMPSALCATKELLIMNMLFKGHSKSMSHLVVFDPLPNVTLSYHLPWQPSPRCHTLRSDKL